MQTIGILLIVVLSAYCAFELFRNIEHAYCTFIKKQIPWVPSIKPLRRAVIHEIQKQIPNAKTAVEIGAGFGGMARMMAHDCDMNVWALENMPFCLLGMRIMNKITFSHNCHIIACDAFKYLEQTRRKFDVGVAYMGPVDNKRLAPVLHKFRILITIDAPIPNVTPTYTVDLSHYGFTRWGGKLYPHMLFVYRK